MLEYVERPAWGHPDWCPHVRKSRGTAPALRIMATSWVTAGYISVCRYSATAGFSLWSWSTTVFHGAEAMVVAVAESETWPARVSPPAASVPTSTRCPPAHARLAKVVGRSFTYV